MAETLERNTQRSLQQISNKPYSLLNQMILKHDGEYATFKQWSDLGGKIRKGEKSEVVVFLERFSLLKRKRKRRKGYQTDSAFKTLQRVSHLTS